MSVPCIQVTNWLPVTRIPVRCDLIFTNRTATKDWLDKFNPVMIANFFSVVNWQDLLQESEQNNQEYWLFHSFSCWGFLCITLYTVLQNFKSIINRWFWCAKEVQQKLNEMLSSLYNLFLLTHFAFYHLFCSFSCFWKKGNGIQIICFHIV